MISTKSAYVAMITITLINGFFSTNMFKKYDDMYKKQITELLRKNGGKTGDELKALGN